MKAVPEIPLGWCARDTRGARRATLTAMKRFRAIAIVGAVGIAACGGANMMPREENLDPVPTAVGPPPPLDDDPVAKVDRLYADLIARQTALSLPAPPSSPGEACEPTCEVVVPPDKPTHTAGCTVGAGSGCASACVEADAACEDAAQICAIAKQLRTNAIAAGRCRAASATCTAAHEPCCACGS